MHQSSVYLQALGIFCLNPGRVAIAGKVRLCALDKTGTLTQAWLDFLGVQPVVPSTTTSGVDSGIKSTGSQGLQRVSLTWRVLTGRLSSRASIFVREGAGLT